MRVQVSCTSSLHHFSKKQPNLVWWHCLLVLDLLSLLDKHQVIQKDMHPIPRCLSMVPFIPELSLAGQTRFGWVVKVSNQDKSYLNKYARQLFYALLALERVSRAFLFSDHISGHFATMRVIYLVQKDQEAQKQVTFDENCQCLIVLLSEDPKQGR